MEKLIELLNEYAYGENKELYYRDREMVEINSERVISKKFWFIKWLVENDKIDFNKVSKKEIESRLSIVMGWVFIEMNWVIMLLSISSSPIEDLTTYLK